MAFWPKILIGFLLVAGCAPRPGPEVLVPEAGALPAGARDVRVLAVTTRAPAAELGFGATRAGRPTWLEYQVSIPPGHKAGQIEWPDPEPDATESFTVRNARTISREGFAREVSGDGPGLYIHGFNTNYQEALFRTAQLSADAQLDGRPVLFTWPSAGSATAYLADRDAADSSRAVLADLMIMLTHGRQPSDPVPVLAHSMGARLTMETLVQLRLAGRSDVLDRIGLVLAAPDIDIDLFRVQMATLGKMRHPVTVLVSSDDPALLASERLATGRVRLGRADVRDPAVQKLALDTGIRILDLTEIETSDTAHSRYVGLFSGEGGIGSNRDPFTEVRQAGAFVFNRVGGVFQGIGGVLGD